MSEKAKKLTVTIGCSFWRVCVLWRGGVGLAAVSRGVERGVAATPCVSDSSVSAAAVAPAPPPSSHGQARVRVPPAPRLQGLPVPRGVSLSTLFLACHHLTTQPFLLRTNSRRGSFFIYVFTPHTFFLLRIVAKF